MTKKGVSSINQEICELCLDCGFDFFSSLPCSYNVDLIHEIQDYREVISVPLVREESGVALSAGAFLGGRKTAMIIQNQGLGNMEGQLLALNSHFEGSYRFPNLYIISHRGIGREKIQAQKPMGQATVKILNKPGIKQCSVESHSDLEKAGKLLKEYEKGYAIALTVKPRYGKKQTNVETFEKKLRNLEGCKLPSIQIQANMTRHEAISTIANQIADEFIVSNMGFSSRELYYTKDRERNFYLTSSLGQTFMLALGLALTIKDINEKIVCLEGDGGLLMNSGSLTLVADQGPENLIMVVLDNGVYGSTGNIPTHTSEGLNLGAVALVHGFPKSNILVAENQDKICEALDCSLNKDGPFFIHVILKPGNADVPVIPLENTEIKARFIKSIQKARNQ